MTTDEPPVVIDWSDEAERLGAAVADDAAWYATNAGQLVRPEDRLAVDVGCGGAGMAIALSRALPSGAHVVGVDGDDDVLDAARRNITAAGLDDTPIRFVHADLDQGLGALADAVTDADIVWASAAIHHIGDQQAAVAALAALLAPGGRLALAEGGLPRRHLPWDLGVGEPGLETRLQAAEDRWFARMRVSLPSSVRMPYGWPSALRRAGLVDVTTRTSTFEKPAPLADAELTKVLDAFSHRIHRITDDGELADDDAGTWARLLDPDDDAWLGRRDDVYVLSARSVHVGHNPTAR